MKVITKSTMPDGTSIQIEDWSESYKFLHKNATIGFYPTSLMDFYNDAVKGMPPYPKRGETFRASLDFPSEEDALNAFQSMVTGVKTFLDYMDFYSSHVIPKESFLLAVAK